MIIELFGKHKGKSKHNIIKASNEMFTLESTKTFKYNVLSSILIETLIIKLWWIASIFFINSPFC